MKSAVRSGSTDLPALSPSTPLRSDLQSIASTGVTEVEHLLDDPN